MQVRQYTSDCQTYFDHGTLLLWLLLFPSSSDTTVLYHVRFYMIKDGDAWEGWGKVTAGARGTDST